MADIKFLLEDDFLDTMETENKKWRETCMVMDHVKTTDGLKLCYYRATPQDPKASVVFVHGMGEFVGKYREYMWYLYRAGFEVFFLEQRGFGHSEGKAPEHDVVYIDSYDTYVKDLYTFVSQKVVPAISERDLFMIAHSMGGCIGALFLEEHPEFVKGAILSSPMMKMQGANYSPLMVELISFYALITGKRKKLAPGQHHFNPNADITKSSAQSIVRFEYQLQQRRNDPDNQMSGASFGWAMASLKATRKVIKNADKIHIPVTVMTAGDDHLIDPEGYKSFKEKVPQADIHPYETSRHEIFNSKDESRIKYYSDILNILDSYLNSLS